VRLAKMSALHVVIPTPGVPNQLQVTWGLGGIQIIAPKIQVRIFFL